MLNMSKRLEAEVSQVLPYAENTIYSPKLFFHNPNTEFALQITNIYSLDIEQHFLESYMGKYKLEVGVNINQYNQLLENIQDLECTLVLYPYSLLFQSVVTEDEPLIFNMRAIFDKVDLSTVVSAKTIGDHDTLGAKEPTTVNQASVHIKLPVYLVEPEVYNTRHMQINGILHNVTVSDAIHWAAYQFGFEEINVVPPDNTDTYGNFVIPPMQDIASFFPFLQKTFGVYSKGLGYFITNKTLYVYPQFDTNLEHTHSGSIIHLLNIPRGTFPSSEGYSRYIDEDLWIVSTTDAHANNTSTKGVENEGNVHVSLNPDNNRDEGVVVKPDGTVYRDESNITILQNVNSRSANSNSQVLKYSGERSNIYNSTAEMSAYNGTYMNTGWVRAKPCSILPGQSVVYHYDDTNDEFAVLTGRVLAVTYGSQILPSPKGSEILLTFMSVIYMFLELNPKYDGSEELP